MDTSEGGGVSRSLLLAQMNVCSGIYDDSVNRDLITASVISSLGMVTIYAS